MSLPAILEKTQGEEDTRVLARKRLRLSVPALLPTGAQNAVVHDISIGGLLLETDSAIGPGESISIELPDARQVEARVAWSSGRFFGCEFTSAISSGLVSASLLKSEPLPQDDDSSEPSEAVVAIDSHEDDLLDRGTLSTAARIQIVVASSLFLWTLIGAAIFVL